MIFARAAGVVKGLHWQRAFSRMRTPRGRRLPTRLADRKRARKLHRRWDKSCPTCPLQSLRTASKWKDKGMAGAYPGGMATEHAAINAVHPPVCVSPDWAKQLAFFLPRQSVCAGSAHSLEAPLAWWRIAMLCAENTTRLAAETPCFFPRQGVPKKYAGDGARFGARSLRAGMRQALRCLSNSK